MVHHLVQHSGALCGCLLPECLQVTTVKQLPEYHEGMGEYCISRLSSLLYIYFILTSVCQKRGFLSYCFVTFLFYFLDNYIQKKMAVNLWQPPPLVSRQKSMIQIKRSTCCHQMLVVGKWLLLKRPTSEAKLSS